MGLYQTFQTNREAETSGRWFELVGVVNADKTVPKFRMRRMGSTNPEYQAAIERVASEMKQAVELDTLTEDIAGPIMRQVFVDTVLVGWENVEGKDGNKIQFSPEAAFTLFEDLPDLYLVLVAEAKKLSNWRAKEVEAVAKKSLPPSKVRSEQTDI